MNPALIPLGEGRELEVDGKRVAVFRCRDGRIFATDPKCPHLGGPLADGTLGGTTVVCPLHNLAFDLTTGAPIGHDCGRLTIINLRS